MEITNKFKVGIAVVVAISFFYFFFGQNLFPRVLVLEGFDNFVRQSDSQQVSNQAGDVESETRLGGLVNIRDQNKGTGEVAQFGRVISVVYIGFYQNENGEQILFDQTGPDNPFTFELGSENLIPGFNVGIDGMRVGGLRFISIDPRAGYGGQVVGPIPANTTLFFLVELIEVE